MILLEQRCTDTVEEEDSLLKLCFRAATINQTVDQFIQQLYRRVDWWLRICCLSKKQKRLLGNISDLISNINRKPDNCNEEQGVGYLADLESCWTVLSAATFILLLLLTVISICFMPLRTLSRSLRLFINELLIHQDYFVSIFIILYFMTNETWELNFILFMFTWLKRQ